MFFLGETELDHIKFNRRVPRTCLTYLILVASTRVRKYLMEELLYFNIFYSEYNKSPRVLPTIEILSWMVPC